MRRWRKGDGIRKTGRGVVRLSPSQAQEVARLADDLGLSFGGAIRFLVGIGLKVYDDLEFSRVLKKGEEKEV